MHRIRKAALLALLLLPLVACTPLRVATAYSSHLTCSETFVSGLPAEDVVREVNDATPGMSLATWGMRVNVDRARQEVRTTFLGGAEARSVYREGAGCLLVRGDGDAPLPVPRIVSEDDDLPAVPETPRFAPRSTTHSRRRTRHLDIRRRS